MSKPGITRKQVVFIEKMLGMPFYHGEKDILISEHVKSLDSGGSWGEPYMNELPLETLCRYLYAPDTVEVEKTVDELLLHHYETSTLLDGCRADHYSSFKWGMETALRIIGRQTPGVITWEE